SCPGIADLTGKRCFGSNGQVGLKRVIHGCSAVVHIIDAPKVGVHITTGTKWSRARRRNVYVPLIPKFRTLRPDVRQPQALAENGSLDTQIPLLAVRVYEFGVNSSNTWSAAERTTAARIAHRPLQQRCAAGDGI